MFKLFIEINLIDFDLFVAELILMDFEFFFSAYYCVHECFGDY